MRIGQDQGCPEMSLGVQCGNEGRQEIEQVQNYLCHLGFDVMEANLT